MRTRSQTKAIIANHRQTVRDAQSERRTNEMKRINAEKTFQEKKRIIAAANIIALNSIMGEEAEMLITPIEKVAEEKTRKNLSIYEPEIVDLIIDIKKLLAQCNDEKSRMDKIKIVNNIYKKIYNKIYAMNETNTLNKFLVTIYCKGIDLLKEIYIFPYLNIEAPIIVETIKNVNKVLMVLGPILKNLHDTNMLDKFLDTRNMAISNQELILRIQSTYQICCI